MVAYNTFNTRTHHSGLTASSHQALASESLEKVQDPQGMKPNARPKRSPRSHSASRSALSGLAALALRVAKAWKKGSAKSAPLFHCPTSSCLHMWIPGRSALCMFLQPQRLDLWMPDRPDCCAPYVVRYLGKVEAWQTSGMGEAGLRSNDRPERGYGRWPR